jgi:hypothetical protein
VFLFLVKECLLDTRNRSCDALVLDVTSYIHMYIYIRPSLLRMHIHAGCAGSSVYPFTRTFPPVCSRPNRVLNRDATTASYDLKSLSLSLSLFLSLSLSLSLSFSDNLLQTGRGSANAELGSVRDTPCVYTCVYMRIRVFGYCYVVWTAVLFYWLAFRRGTTRAIIESCVSIVARRCV